MEKDNIGNKSNISNLENTENEKHQQRYNTWLEGLEHYLELYEKGLKKQANHTIRSFVDDLEQSVPREALEEILCRFCREICDEKKHTRFLHRGNGSLPYDLSRVVWGYLKRQCEQEAMPQMRWAFQLFGASYNPFNPQMELNLWEVLEKAYRHKGCDSKTVELYMTELLGQLGWGAHHFPEGCLIKRETYEATVKAIEEVLEEKQVPENLTEQYFYYRKLYQCFYEYEESGREQDFYELCKKAGIVYRSSPAYYFR